jgi:uncharacterized protein YdaU (DUF1376 family)
VHFYAFRINDWWAATGHLSLTEEAIYRRLVDHYMRTEQPLNPEVKALARVIRAPGEAETIAAILEEFFQPTESGWIHPDFEEQLSAYSAKSAKASNSAKKRWDAARVAPMQTQCDRIADAMQTQCEGNANHEPITMNHEPITMNHEEKTREEPEPPAEKKPPARLPRVTARSSAAERDVKKPVIERPEDCPQQAWDDWKKSRGRAILTPTAWAMLCSEATKAGISPGKAVEIAAGHGWRGFKAEWLKKAKQGRRESIPLDQMVYDATPVGDLL